MKTPKIKSPLTHWVFLLTKLLTEHTSIEENILGLVIVEEDRA